MFDRAQWFLVGMSITLSVQLSQPVVAAVSVGKVVQTALTTADFRQIKYTLIPRTYQNGLQTLATEVQLPGGCYNSTDAEKEGVQLYQQGTAEAKRGAIAKFEQALKLCRERGDRLGEASILNSIGLVYLELREPQKALEYYSQSLSLSRVLGLQRWEAHILHQIGEVYSKLGEPQKALEYYSQSLPLSRVVGNPFGEAATFYSMAYVKREQNNLTEALNDIESSLKIIENLRITISSSKLPSSYFATVQEYYKFYVALLMQLHKTNPNSGYDIKASEASKRANTR